MIHTMGKGSVYIKVCLMERFVLVTQVGFEED